MALSKVFVIMSYFDSVPFIDKFQEKCLFLYNVFKIEFVYYPHLDLESVSCFLNLIYFRTDFSVITLVSVRVKSVQSALTHLLTTSGPRGTVSPLSTKRGCISVGLVMNSDARGWLEHCYSCHSNSRWVVLLDNHWEYYMENWRQ